MSNFYKSSHRNESEFMAPKVAAKHYKPRKSSHITLLVIGSLVVSFLIWATFADIDVVTRGTGTIIASQKTQVIANLEGGIVKEVFVKQGDVVEANQVLMRIDPTIADAHYKKNREQYFRYLVAATRLEAQLEGKKFQVSDSLRREYP